MIYLSMEPENFTAPSLTIYCFHCFAKGKGHSHELRLFERNAFTFISSTGVMVLRARDRFSYFPCPSPIPAPSQDDTAGESSYSVHPPPPHPVIPPLDLVDHVSNFLFFRPLNVSSASRQAGTEAQRLDSLASSARFAVPYPMAPLP